MKGDVKLGMANNSKNHKRTFNWKLIFFIVILIMVSLIIWSVFFSYTECTTWKCFNQHLANCNRAKFIGGTGMIFKYTIIGNSNSGCVVGVQLLQGELDKTNSLKLEKQKMICTLPKGVVMLPESDIGKCHGLLKEGLQDLIIEKLHTYIVQNLDKINLNMFNISGAN